MENTNIGKMQTETTEKISWKDTLRLMLDIMPDDEVEEMLKMFSYADIHKLFNEPESVKYVTDLMVKWITRIGVLFKAMEHIPIIVANKEKLLRECMVPHHDELVEESQTSIEA